MVEHNANLNQNKIVIAYLKAFYYSSITTGDPDNNRNRGEAALQQGAQQRLEEV